MSGPEANDGRHPSLVGMRSGSLLDGRMRPRADLVWYLRHADALARWPVLIEPWALRVELRRLAQPGVVRPPTIAGR